MALLALFDVASCARIGAKSGVGVSAVSRAHVVAEGEVVRATEDPLTGLTSYDPSLLFHLAGEEHRRGNAEKALTLYLRFVREFPDNSRTQRAQFSAAVIEEDLGRLDAAAGHYRELVEGGFGGNGEAQAIVLDAHYRLAVVHEKQGDYAGATDVYDRILALANLSPFDVLEAGLGRGVALRHAGLLDAAETALAETLRAAERERETQLQHNGGLLAEVAYALGEIANDRYAAVRLELPVDALRARLVQKCELLLLAQQRYVRAIRYGNARMAAMAGYRIGALYETLHAELTEVRLPADLDTEEIAVYREEVRRRIRVLLAKALVVYEKSLLVGRSASTAVDATQRLERALERLRVVFLQESDEAREGIE